MRMRGGEGDAATAPASEGARGGGGGGEREAGRVWCFSPSGKKAKKQQGRRGEAHPSPVLPIPKRMREASRLTRNQAAPPKPKKKKNT